MTTEQDRNDPVDEALRSVLGDAVAQVQPGDRLGEIRRRTRAATRRPRRWLPVVAGAGVATAAVVGGAVVLGQLGRGDDAGAPLARPAVDPETRATAVYFVDDAPGGLRLFREFQSLPVADEAGTITHALARVDPSGGPDDPDYDTVWPEGSFTDVTVAEDRVVVTLSSEALERPVAASARDVRVGIQQVVYTAEAALGEALPVAFEYEGAPAEVVLGVEAPPLVERNRSYDVISPVNISDPSEGAEVEGGVLTIRGTTSGLVDGVVWTISEVAGASMVLAEPRAEGRATGRSLDDSGVQTGLLMWQRRIDVSDLGPGRYLLTATVTEPRLPPSESVRYRDTRTFVIP